MMFVEEDFVAKKNKGCRNDVCWKDATTKVVVVLLEILLPKMLL
jgi:hypothetical protein